MLVSTVTPSFNQGRYLGDVIQSVLSQDYPQIEHMIVEGGSTDDTVSSIKKYEHHLAWWVSEKNQGMLNSTSTSDK